MKLLMLLAALVGGYYLHGRYVFSEDVMQGWISTQSRLAMQGDERACTYLDDNLRFTLVEESQRGQKNLQGDKQELCAYYHTISETLNKAGATTDSTVEGLTVTRRPFPWQDATVSYSHRVKLYVPNRQPTTAGYATTVTVKRTLRGPKILEMHSVSYADGPAAPAKPASGASDTFSRKFSETF